VPLLRSADYAVQVVNDSTALEKVQRESPLVIIVGGAADLNLYRVLRGASTALILALVSDSDRERILEAFDAGVDDYQVVPISSAEIVARVHSMLRSVQRQSPSKFLA